jgi:hypothetical protein
LNVQSLILGVLDPLHALAVALEGSELELEVHKHGLNFDWEVFKLAQELEVPGLGHELELFEHLEGFDDLFLVHQLDAGLQPHHHRVERGHELVAPQGQRVCVRSVSLQVALGLLCQLAIEVVPDCEEGRHVLVLLGSLQEILVRVFILGKPVLPEQGQHQPFNLIRPERRHEDQQEVIQYGGVDHVCFADLLEQSPGVLHEKIHGLDWQVGQGAARRVAAH